MASPLNYFRKHQKIFMVVAAVVAIFVFVFADMFLSMSSSGGGSSKNQVAVEWDGGKVTVGELEHLRNRRVFLDQISKLIYSRGRAVIESEGGTAPEPTVPMFLLQEQITGQQLAIQVVDDRVTSLRARESGIVVSNNTINQHYLYELGLGRVSGPDIEQLMVRLRGEKNLRSSKDMLFSGLRELLLGHLYNRSVGVSADGVEPTTLWDGWQTLNRRIKLEAAVLPAEDFLSEVPEPTDVELVGFYEDNKGRYVEEYFRQAGRQFPTPQPGFRQRSKVRLKYLVGDLNAWTEKLIDTVTEEEIVEYYEANKDSEFLKFDPIFDDLDGEKADKLDEIFLEGENGESASEDGKTDEDSSDSAAEEDAVSEEKEIEEEPSESDTSSISAPSPFQLAALQTDAEQSTSGGSSAEESADAAADEASSEETAEEDDSEADSKPKYEPLENVREEIRRKLATDKAVEKLSNSMESCYGQLSRVYNRYGRELAASKDEKSDPPEIPEALQDLSNLAKEHDLYYEETEPRSIQELSEIPVGSAQSPQNQSQRVYRMAFGSLELYEPIMAVDAEGYQYLILKVEEIPEQTPPFKDIREEVVERWKLAEAKKLALEKGREMAKKAQEEKLDVADVLGEDEYKIVLTDFFSKLDFGTAPNRQPTARLGEAPPLTNLGLTFMNAVFEMGDEEVLALPNYEGSEVYVLKLHQKERTESELKQTFLNSFGSSRELVFLYQSQMNQKVRLLQSQIFADAMYDRQGFYNLMQRSASQQ